MRKTEKTFFDEDITIDEKLFKNFKLNNIASWSHLELWCTLQNIEITYDFFKGILCGTAVINQLFDMMLDAIENTDFLDKYIDDLNTIEIIEKLFIVSNTSRTFKGKEFWIDIAYEQDCDGAYADYFNSGKTSDDEKKYKLLNAIFRKNPFVALKFYNKNKLILHMHDNKFERWLADKFKKLSKHNKLFEQIHDALCSETKKLNSLTMYLQ